jgi:hypothetical protein
MLCQVQRVVGSLGLSRPIVVWGLLGREDDLIFRSHQFLDWTQTVGSHLDGSDKVGDISIDFAGSQRHVQVSNHFRS